VNFQIERGEIIGIVGESGCGKSVSALSLLRLNASNAVYGSDSEIILNGKNLLKLKERQMREIRGKEIAVIFQDSLTGLDPVMPIKKIMTEAIRAHKKISKEEALKESIATLAKVGIPAPEVRIHEYAHQLSGGMRQRVMIALAMLHNSKLLIADEPTTALDVTIQDHILQLLKWMRDEQGMSVVLITHDMGVVAEMTDRIYVMYAGRIVEEAPTRDIFESPLHPYTKGLLQSIPRLDQPDGSRLYTIPGTVPSPGTIKKGCRFCNRCQECQEKCREEEPPLFELTGKKVRCWKYESVMEVYL
jgi:peptide/nickel transport system ATP-binding protein/oligopeptide transport system ATP-binding protein